jgi:serine/threonine protein phosphatase PrpC
MTASSLECAKHSGDPESVIKPDFYEVNLRDTLLLLSSDGLHDYRKKERIQEIILAKGEPVEKSCKDLAEEALSAGSDDNVTIVLVYGTNKNPVFRITHPTKEPSSEMAYKFKNPKY